MKELILITMFFASSIFAQNPLINGLWANAGGDGNLLESTKLTLIDANSKGLWVLSGKFTLSQTGAQIQTILDGTISGFIHWGTLAFKSADGTESRGEFRGGTNSQDAYYTIKDKGEQISIRLDAGGVSYVDGRNAGLSFAIGKNTADERLDINDPVVQFDSLKVHRERSWIADDGEIALATGVAGMGTVIIGDNTAWAYVTFTSAGAVTIEDSKGSVVNTDTDTNLCIYDAGTGIAIKNRLGSALTVMIDISYADPTP